MPAGLQVYGPTGALKLDLSDRIGRWLFTVIVPGGPGSYAYSHPGLLQGRPIPFCHMYAADGSASFPGDNLMTPDISFAGDTMYYAGAASTFRISIWVY